MTFVGIGETSRDWISICADPSNNKWAATWAGSQNIYKCLAGTTTFSDINGPAYTWYDICSDPDGNTWICGNASDIYKCLAGTTTFSGIGETSRAWNKICSDPDGNMWATIDSGDIYKCLAGTTTFSGIGETSRSWRGICSDPDGNMWATVYNGDIYVTKWNVVYDDNDADSGTVPIDTNGYLAGENVTASGNTGSLAKTGHTFTGWNTAADGSGTHYAISASVPMTNTDLILYADWGYHITYDGNTNTGGTVPTDASTYPIGATVTVLSKNTLVKTGYYFECWNTAADGSGTDYDPADTFAISGNTTLYAKWHVNHKITYDANGGTVASRANLLDLWAFDDDTGNDSSGNGNDLTQTDVSYVAGKRGHCASYNGSTSKSTRTLSARTSDNDFSLTGWILIDPDHTWNPTSYVYFIGAGSAGGSFGFVSYPSEENKILGASCDGLYRTAVPTNILTRGVWAFMTLSYTGGSTRRGKLYIDGVYRAQTAQLNSGYSFDADFAIAASKYITGSSPTYSKIKTDEVRIYDKALTQEEITLLYTYVNDLNFDDPTTYALGDDAPALGNVWTYTKATRSFSGWNTSVSGTGTHYDVGSAIPISADITLYADWKCQVTYDGNGNTGGTVPTDSTLYFPGSNIVVGGVSGEPIRVGYTFGGWNTAADGSGDTYLPGSLFTLNNNTTLYAYWTIIPTKQRLVYLDFQDGVGYRDVSSMVKYETLSVTQRACSDNFHYVQNEANFDLVYDATIYALLRTATKEILCKIISQNGDTLTTWFTGKIAPTKSRTYNGVLDIIEWKVSAEDRLQELNGSVGDICYTNYSIMNPASPSTSIVHQLAYIRGFTVLDIGTVTISGTISKFAPNSEDDSVLDILDTLLFEYGYVLNIDADGKLTPIKWINDSAASFNFTEDNIVREVSVDDSVKDYYGAELIWYELTQTSKDILLYRDDNCQYTPGEGWDGYTILPGTTYPPETNVWDTTISGYSVVYQEYSDDAIKYWTNYAIVNKLDYNYKVFDSDFSGIVATSGWWLDASYDTGITVTSVFYNKKARIIYSNPTGGSLQLNYNNVYGTCWYKSAKRTLKVDNTTISGQKIDEYVSSFIFDGTTASGFVQHLAAQYAVGTVYYTVISESAVAKGSIVSITMNDGTNQNCLITERIWEESEELYTYKCRAYSPDQGTVTGRTYSAPPVISPREVITSYLNPYYVSVGANVDGSSPDLTNAYTDMRIYKDSKEVTYDWTYSATTSGVSGSFGTGTYANRYTVSGFDSNATKHGTVAITASRAGYTSQTLTFTIDKIYQSDAVSSETVYSHTPHYLGRAAYASPPTANVFDDTCTLYSTTSGLRGIYKWVAGSPDAWVKQTTPTTEMIGAAWADICWAVNQVTDYGETTEYSGSGVNFIDVLGANIAFLNKIFAQYLKIQTGGSMRGGDRYDEDGEVIDGTVPGFYISASGACKVAGIEFEGSQGGGVQWSGGGQIGTELNIATVGTPAICALNETDIAFIDATNCDLRVYRFDGSAWSMIGSELNIATAGYSAICALNETDIAFIDSTNEDLRLYRWDGSAWSMIGSELNIATVGLPSICALNETDIAFIDSTNKDLRVYRWGGSSWSLVGSELSITLELAAICALNSADIAYVDTYRHWLCVYRWSGSSWNLVGTPLTINPDIGASSISALNGTDIAFIDSINDQLRIYRWDGATWTQLVSAGSPAIGGGDPALCALNGTDIAFIDSTNDDLRVYRFAFALSKPWRYPFTF